jgi:hypothetical protein
MTHEALAVRTLELFVGFVLWKPNCQYGLLRLGLTGLAR